MCVCGWGWGGGGVYVLRSAQWVTSHENEKIKFSTYKTFQITGQKKNIKAILKKKILWNIGYLCTCIGYMWKQNVFFILYTSFFLVIAQNYEAIKNPAHSNTKKKKSHFLPLHVWGIELDEYVGVRVKRIYLFFCALENRNALFHLGLRSTIVSY